MMTPASLPSDLITKPLVVNAFWLLCEGQSRQSLRLMVRTNGRSIRHWNGGFARIRSQFPPVKRASVTSTDGPKRRGPRVSKNVPFPVSCVPEHNHGILEGISNPEFSS
jgi:hypothetical protein